MTFTKLFSSITASTIWAEDDHTRLVWITMLAMSNKNGYVFASVPGLAAMARVPLESVVKALAKLQGPDEWSRTKEFEGRRIEEVDGGWRLLNYLKHRAIRDEEERRTYMKEYMRERRKPDALTDDVAVNSRQPRKAKLAHTEAEAEADSDTEAIKTKKQSVHFTIPSLGEISAYCKELGGKIDPQEFFDYYTSNGWMVGKNHMKDWRSTVRRWGRQERKGQGNGYKTAGERRNERIDAQHERALREVDNPENESMSIWKRPG